MLHIKIKSKSLSTPIVGYWLGLGNFFQKRFNRRGMR